MREHQSRSRLRHPLPLLTCISVFLPVLVMSSKYDDWDESDDEEVTAVASAGSKYDEDDERTQKRTVPPPKGKPPAGSSKRVVLPPPSGGRPTHLSAVSAARLKYAKPPSGQPSGIAGAGARAAYMRAKQQKEHADRYSSSFSSKVAEEDEPNDVPRLSQVRSRTSEGIQSPRIEADGSDEDRRERPRESTTSDRGMIDSGRFPNVFSDDDEEEDDNYMAHDIDEDAWRMTSSKSGGRRDSPSSGKSHTKSTFFSDDDDDDTPAIPDLEHWDHDDLKQEFGLDSWADKKEENRRHRITTKKKRSSPEKKFTGRGKIVMRQEVSDKDRMRRDKGDGLAGRGDNMGGEERANPSDCPPQIQDQQSPVEVGDTVEAKAAGWLRFYGGVVTRRARDGTFEVRFHDGELKDGIPLRDITLISSGCKNSRNLPAETRRSSSQRTERASPKSPKLHETNINGVETLRFQDGEDLKVKTDVDEGKRGEDAENASPTPKGSATEPKGMKRDEMTPYNVNLVPSRRSDLMKFLILPPYQGVNKNIRCYILRDTSGMFRFNPLYTFHIEKNNKKDSRQLMVAQKLMGCSSLNYLISIDREDMGKSYNSRSKWYMGKLQAKKGADEFILYDRGMNPHDLVDLVKSTQWEMKESAARREMAAVVYNRKKDTVKSRRMEVSLPAVVRDDGKTVTEAQFRPFTDDDSMYKLFGEVRAEGTQNVKATERILCLQNRTFSAGKTSILSDFKGRANETSVKNFQLCVSHPAEASQRKTFMDSKLGQSERDDPERVLLQLGRDSERFNVDFTYPMSFFAAFGICLTRFATKANEDF